MFCARVYRQGRELVLAASDDDIIGKEFRQGRLHIAVRPEFYGTDKVSADFLLAQLRSATIANLVGHRVVALAIEHGFITEDNVIRIDGVPHAQLAVFG